MQAQAADMIHARGDLERKSMRLMQSHYGTVRYILAYAVAGETITFHVITTDGEVRGCTSHPKSACVHYLPFPEHFLGSLTGAGPPRCCCTLEWQVRAAILVKGSTGGDPMCFLPRCTAAIVQLP